jgi:hypothetical protein
MRLMIIDRRQSAKAATGNPSGNNLNAGRQWPKGPQKEDPGARRARVYRRMGEGVGWGHPALIPKHRMGASVPGPSRIIFDTTKAERPYLHLLPSVPKAAKIKPSNCEN